MKNWKRAARLIVETLVAPRSAFASFGEATPLAASCMLLGLLVCLQQLAQAWVLAPVVAADPLSAETPGGPQAALHSYWLLRLLVCCAAPLGLLLRSAAFASVVHAGGLLLGKPGPWRSLLGLGLHLEIIFWIEGACATVLLWLQPPESLQAVQSMQLHAGLDLLWHPESQTLQALLASANAFTLWWGALLAIGLTSLLQLRGRKVAALALPLWLALVGLRYLMQPHAS